MQQLAIEAEIIKAIEKWTVYKLIEPHFDINDLEHLKSSILQHILKENNSGVKEEQVLIYELSIRIYDLLEDIAVDCDRESCTGISIILIGLHNDLKRNILDFARRIEESKSVEVKGEEAETSFDQEEGDLE